MYRLILDLPFNVLAVWYRLFKTEEQAKDIMYKLPSGFAVVDTETFETLLPLRLISVVPFGKEMET